MSAEKGFTVRAMGVRAGVLPNASFCLLPDGGGDYARDRSLRSPRTSTHYNQRRKFRTLAGRARPCSRKARPAPVTALRVAGLGARGVLRVRVISYVQKRKENVEQNQA